MREIKFRAWDKTNKKMFMVVRLDRSSTIVILVDSKNTSYEVHQDNLELMQYTGMIDKNGKEIYEGDIISDNSLKEERIQEVTWFFPRFFFDPKPKDHIKLGYGVVIGNKFENPELLNEK